MTQRKMPIYLQMKSCLKNASNFKCCYRHTLMVLLQKYKIQFILNKNDKIIQNINYYCYKFYYTSHYTIYLLYHTIGPSEISKI